MGWLSLVTIALGKLRQEDCYKFETSLQSETVSGSNNTKKQLQWWCLPVLPAVGMQRLEDWIHAWFTYMVNSEVSLNYVTGSQEGVM